MRRYRVRKVQNAIRIASGCKDTSKALEKKAPFAAHWYRITQINSEIL